MGRGLRKAFILLLVQFILALAGCSEGVSTTQNLNLIPIQKPPRISAGKFHTCAVASDGTLWCWGRNDFGQLGDGTRVERNKPVRVGEDSDWVGVSAGSNYSCGIKTDGTLWCWGEMMPKFWPLVPVKVEGTGWVSVSAGPWHTCGIKMDGTLWCWGDNYNGQLEDGTFESATNPVQVGKDSDWAAVYAATEAYTCALKKNGTLWCWGGCQNRTGDCDYMEDEAICECYNVPVKLENSPWVDIAIGSDHICGIKKEGTLWCWGSNYVGQLGIGAPEYFGEAEEYSISEPAQVGEYSDWINVSSKHLHSCAVRGDGSLWCWGLNDHYQLGNIGGRTSNVPVKVGESGEWEYVSAGYYHTCGMKKDGTYWCWGDNFYGQLGDGKGGNRYVPELVHKTSECAVVSTGGYETCAIETDGTLKCWGRETYEDKDNKNWLTVSGGGLHVCALKRDGTLWCWGDNMYGNLGIGSPDKVVCEGWNPGTGGPDYCYKPNRYKHVPTQVGNDSDWKKISLGGEHTCAIKTNGTLWCWGRNNYGQLGDGTYVDRYTPVQIGADANWSYVFAGGSHTCAVKFDGSLWCWGDNTYGQLGDGSNKSRNTPTRIGSDTNWVFVSAGGFHTCGVKSDGSLWCWGGNSYGQLGNGTTSSVYNPVQVGTGTHWTSVSAGDFHTCAVKTDGTLWCWGWNLYGQVGAGDTSDIHLIPVQVGSEAEWSSVSAGYNYTCALKQNGTLWCWGSNEYFQLGYYPRSATPVKVLLE